MLRVHCDLFLHYITDKTPQTFWSEGLFKWVCCETASVQKTEGWTGGCWSHTNLQPLVDGLSCSELTRLKALELLGGEGLWELELWEREKKHAKSMTTVRETLKRVLLTEQLELHNKCSVTTQLSESRTQTQGLQAIRQASRQPSALSFLLAHTTNKRYI